MSRRESTTSGNMRFSKLANIMVNVFLSGELKRKDDLLASMDKKQDEAREKMQEVNMLNMHILDTYSPDQTPRILPTILYISIILTTDIFRSKCRCRNSRLPPTKRNDE